MDGGSKWVRLSSGPAQEAFYWKEGILRDLLKSARLQPRAYNQGEFTAKVRFLYL
jgi:hypothetical protein